MPIGWDLFGVHGMGGLPELVVMGEQYCCVGRRHPEATRPTQPRGAICTSAAGGACLIYC